MTKSIKRNTKINQGTCDALRVLIVNGKMSVNEAAKALSIGSSTASRMVHANYDFVQYKKETLEAMQEWKNKKNGVSEKPQETSLVGEDPLINAITELLRKLEETNHKLSVLGSKIDSQRPRFFGKL